MCRSLLRARIRATQCENERATAGGGGMDGRARFCIPRARPSGRAARATLSVARVTLQASACLSHLSHLIPENPARNSSYPDPAGRRGLRSPPLVIHSRAYDFSGTHPPPRPSPPPGAERESKPAQPRPPSAQRGEGDRGRWVAGVRGVLLRNQMEGSPDSPDHGAVQGARRLGQDRSMSRSLFRTRIRALFRARIRALFRARIRALFRARIRALFRARIRATQCESEPATASMIAGSTRPCSARGTPNAARPRPFRRGRFQISRPRPFRRGRPGRAGLLIPRPRLFRRVRPGCARLRRARPCPAESHSSHLSQLSRLSHSIPANPAQIKQSLSRCTGQMVPRVEDRGWREKLYVPRAGPYNPRARCCARDPIFRAHDPSGVRDSGAGNSGVQDS